MTPPPDETPTLDRRRLRNAGANLGLTVASLLAFLLLLELGLRGLALFYGEREIRMPGGDEREVILTLGDSHTYGVYYAAEDSYPGRLQNLLDASAPGRYMVVNRGLPGTNSQEIVGRLPEWLLRHRPSHVVLCVGVNNSWNVTRADEVEDSWLELRTLRLARLTRLAWQRHDLGRPPLEREIVEGGVVHRNAETGEVLIEHRGNLQGGAIDLRTATGRLRRDLEAVASLARRRGIRLTLLTYAASERSWGKGRALMTNAMSDVMVAVAAEQQLEIVDVRDRFAELTAPPASLPDYFSDEGKDTHPNPAGYAEIARRVADRILSGP